MTGRRSYVTDPDRLARYRAMADEGLTVAQVAGREGAKWATVYAYGRRHGIHFASEPVRTRFSRAAFAAAWADRSIPVEDIARRFGICSVRYASRLARQLGLPVRRRGPAVICDATEFRAMWLAGCLRADMARILGLNAGTITIEARRLGLPMRGKGWTGGITLATYQELRLARAMAADAASTREAMVQSEMVDRIAGRPRKSDPAGRVA